MTFIQRLRSLFQKSSAEIDHLEQQSESGVIDRNEYYDQLTRLILAETLNNKSVCVDVGCHEGAILKLMIEQAPEGTFHGFEPLPHLFEHLKNTFDHDSRIQLHNLALSDQAGESSFNYVISNPGYSGLIKRNYDRPEEEDTTITVKTERLDTLLGNSRLDFIKIDVEGAEYQVLSGGVEIIRREKPVIVFEHGMGAADCYQTTPEMVYDLLHDRCGLKINLLNQFLRKQEPLDRNGFCQQFYQGINYYFIAS